jgi:hypothetical protein
VVFTNCKPLGKLYFIFTKRLTLFLLFFRIDTEETIVNYTVHNSTDNDIYKNNIQKRHQMVFLIPLLALLVGVFMILKATIFFFLLRKLPLASINLLLEKLLALRSNSSILT